MTTFLTWLIPPGILVFTIWGVLHHMKVGRIDLIEWIPFYRETTPILFWIAQGILALLGLFMFLIISSVVYFD